MNLTIVSFLVRTAATIATADFYVFTHAFYLVCTAGMPLRVLSKALDFSIGLTRRLDLENKM